MLDGQANPQGTIIAREPQQSDDRLAASVSGPGDLILPCVRQYFRITYVRWGRGGKPICQRGSDRANCGMAWVLALWETRDRMGADDWESNRSLKS